MKREISTIWLLLLLIASGIILAWAYLMYEMSGMILYDANASVVKDMTTPQQEHMYAGAKGLIRMTCIPMAILSMMWVIAFVSERREHNKLRKMVANQGLEGTGDPRTARQSPQP